MTIKPRHAASIWTVDDKLFCELPSTRGEKAHTISFPNSLIGLAAALKMLNSRTESSLIGTTGDPTQHQLDKSQMRERAANFILAGGKVKAKPTFSPGLRDSAREVLKRLGMI